MEMQNEFEPQKKTANLRINYADIEVVVNQYTDFTEEFREEKKILLDVQPSANSTFRRISITARSPKSELVGDKQRHDLDIGAHMLRTVPTFEAVIELDETLINPETVEEQFANVFFWEGLDEIDDPDAVEEVETENDVIAERFRIETTNIANAYQVYCSASNNEFIVGLQKEDNGKISIKVGNGLVIFSNNPGELSYESVQPGVLDSSLTSEEVMSDFSRLFMLALNKAAKLDSRHSSNPAETIINPTRFIINPQTDDINVLLQQKGIRRNNYIFNNPGFSTLMRNLWGIENDSASESEEYLFSLPGLSVSTRRNLTGILKEYIDDERKTPSRGAILLSRTDEDYVVSILEAFANQAEAELQTLSIYDCAAHTSSLSNKTALMSYFRQLNLLGNRRMVLFMTDIEDVYGRNIADANRNDAVVIAEALSEATLRNPNLIVFTSARSRVGIPSSFTERGVFRKTKTSIIENKIISDEIIEHDSYTEAIIAELARLCVIEGVKQQPVLSPVLETIDINGLAKKARKEGLTVSQAQKAIRGTYQTRASQSGSLVGSDAYISNDDLKSGIKHAKRRKPKNT